MWISSSKPIWPKTRRVSDILRSRHAVSKVLDYWIPQWWIREEKRVYFRVDCEGAIMEIFKRDGEWVLARMMD